ncbi:MAG: CBS domain-containing protein [Acidilobaceae archaeon]
MATHYASLKQTHREVLEALIKIYEQTKKMVKTKDVAKYLNKEEWVVRNAIMWLRSMGFVESKTGPAGGYIPTLKAYEVIRSTTYIARPMYGFLIIYDKEGLKEEMRMAATSVELLNIFTSEKPRALVKVVGDVSGVEEKRKVRLESVPKKRFVAEGVIQKRDVTSSEILIEIMKLAVIPDEQVGNVCTRGLVTLSYTASLREAAKVLSEHGIRGAPVLDNTGAVVGFITTSDIAQAVANREDLDSSVTNFMRKTIFVVNENESITEAMRIMDFYGVGRLLVVDSQKRPVGILTRTDILRYILAL